MTAVSSTRSRNHVLCPILPIPFEATVHLRGFPILLHLLSLQLYWHEHLCGMKGDRWFNNHFRLDEYDESWSDFDEDSCCFLVVLNVGSRWI